MLKKTYLFTITLIIISILFSLYTVSATDLDMDLLQNTEDTQQQSDDTNDESNEAESNEVIPGDEEIPEVTVPTTRWNR